MYKPNRHCRKILINLNLYLSCRIIVQSIFVVILFPVTLSQNACPQTIAPPCVCTSSTYEPLNLYCERAGNLAVVLSALGPSLDSVTADSLTLARTSLSALKPFAFGSLSTKRLVLTHNNISSLSSQAFDGPLLNVLEEIDLDDNFLGDHPRGFFGAAGAALARLSRLKFLSVAKNAIKTMDPGGFRTWASYSTLYRIDLSSNSLRLLHPDAFTGLTGMEQLNLDKNFLGSVPFGALAPVSDTLQDLSLGVNGITHLPAGVLRLPLLKSLSLEVNSISELHPNALSGTPQLVYLYMGSNALARFDSEIFRNTPRLRVLVLSNNPFGGRPGLPAGNFQLPSNAFVYIPGLVRLEMAQCSITSIASGSLQLLRDLQVLVLSRNKLTDISSSTFGGLTSLYSLDLKGNHISRIEPKAFAGLTSLRHLDLSTNRITTIEPSIFAGSLLRTTPSTSRVVYLYENPWRCDSSIAPLLDWLRRNASDLSIDAPGYPPSSCGTPSNLLQTPLRQVDEGTLIGPSVIKPPSPLNPGNRNARDLRLSGVNLAAVILGIIMGVLVLTVALLLLMRYFMSERHRRLKVEDDDRRRFARLGSSCASSSNYTGYPSPSPTHSGGGSPPIHTISSNYNNDLIPPGAYLSERGFARRQRTGTYFLNRPWYWWF